MTGLGHCPNCGSVLPADSPHGLCPVCLMEQAMAPHGLDEESSRPPTTEGPAIATTTLAPPPATAPGLDPPATEPIPVDGEANGLPPGSFVSYFGDYELLGVLGRGGMGIVYKARQISLNRLVALKMLQAGTPATEDDLRRFQNEAEAVAMLDHPSIVPIFEVGEHDGRRYFSMKLIDGPDLHRRLGGFADDPRAAARLARTVAEAVHHAHQRGILHRDLKPGNVLLDERGEPHVTDFGLAKRFRAAGDLTMSGAIVGTPAYMAPEQASGNRRLVTTATDVYGLGAILYAMVTGRAPFRGDSPVETLDRVRGAPPEPPSRLNPRVPRDLETIIGKCLEKEPDRRYASAAAVADDLRRYLDGEPILARPVGLATRAWLWCKRNPALAGLMLAALTMLVMQVGVMVVERGRRREAEARELAERNYHLARRAVEEYFTSVSEDTLLKKQDSVDLRLLRKKLLETALRYYRDFLRQPSGDPELRREMADAYFRVGQILREVGDKPEEAITAFQGSIATLEELLSTSPGDRDLRAELARASLALGEQCAEIRDFPRAFTSLTRSREILARLVDDVPTDASFRLSLSGCDLALGVAAGETGDLDRGLGHLKEAESLLRGLLSGSPGDAGFRRRLADTLNARGFIHAGKRQDDEALRAFGQYQQITQSLLAEVRSGPLPMQLLNALADSYDNVGAIRYPRDRGKALESFEKALEYRSVLAVAHPSVDDIRGKLAMVLSEIAPLRHEAGRSEGAFDAARRSVEILDGLAASRPDQTRYHAELGRALNILGHLHDEARDNVQALPAFERALREAERAAAGSPESELYKQHVIDVLQNLGEQHADLGRPGEGLPYFRQAVEARRRLLAARPGDRDRTLELADQLAMLGSFERRGGHPEEAGRTYAEAAAVLAPLTPDADVRMRRGAFLMEEGRAAADRGLDARALDFLWRAVAILEPLVDHANGDPRPPQRLTEAYWECARVSRRHYRPDDAASLDARRRALWEGRPPGELAALALEVAARAATVGYGRTPAGDRIEAVRRLDLDFAAEHLKLAASLGLRDPDLLKKGRDARLLFERPDIRPMLDDITFPEDPFVPPEIQPK